MGLVCAFASAILHVAYFLLLQRGYQIGDLSVVYPIARGTAPVLTTVAAVVLLGERPSLSALWVRPWLRWVFLSWRNPTKATAVDGRRAVAFGLVTGVLIACYTICDKLAVANYGVPPLIQQWGTSLGIAIFLAPVTIRSRPEVRDAVEHEVA